MIRKTLHILLAIFSFLSFAAHSQNIIEKSLAYSTDTIVFDTVSVYRTGFSLRVADEEISPTDYYLDPIYCKLLIKSNRLSGPIFIKYERMPVDFSQTFKHKSSNLIISDTVENYNPFIYSVSTANPNDDLFGSSKLNKQGSISRGVTVGNAQNLSLQSTLNLQLDGQIGPNLFMKGSISDDNIPFQPEGNTQKLQEFDQVYLKVYNDDFAVIGGDFWLRKPKGYFMNYVKRTQGVSIEAYHPMDIVGAKGTAKHKFSGAFSKGKFARNIIQGVEGNQGPYRLKGVENETFIVILAGTEKVYIDGVLLKRGQEFDYTIDYNTAEVTFTANQLITKDKRMVVEFQYSDLNYARSLVAYSGEFKGEKYHTWINVYSEQDAKNQPIQQTLNNDKKAILIGAGDSLINAFSNSIDSVGFFDSRVLYAMIDSLGVDSVLLFSVNPDSAYFQASFSFVGAGNGNYIFDRFTANGKVYRWVFPTGGVPQGDYEPIQLLVAPQKKRMISIGTEYIINKSVRTSAEIAFSNYDKNTFSSQDAADNGGIAVKWDWKADNFINTAETWKIQSRINFEFQQKNFERIQWFRSVEFDRDWNVRNQPFTGDQYLSDAGFKFIGKNVGAIGYDFQNFIWGTDYTGFRNNLNVNLHKRGFKMIADGSLLTSNGVEKTSFLRHKAAMSYNFKWIKIGVEDIHELNEKFLSGNPVLQLSSYQFFDWKAYVSTSDTLKNQFSIYYRERYDWFSDSVQLNQAVKAQNIGFKANLLKNRKNIIRLNVNYRKLFVLDTNLYKSKPENTILNRLEHVLRIWKGALTTTTFYELGSGLELKKEFVFIEVNPGQGTYTWIDYNNDGVKDLGEFEIAVFADQGNYIRVFIPTNNYVRTYSNQFSSSLIIRPDRIWRSKKGVKKVLSRVSNQVVYKINRKTSYEDGFQAFNPFVYTISDTSLISVNSSFRNTLYFNQTSSVFGLNYSYQENGSKILLSNGFDSRLHTFHQFKLRMNINKYYNIRVDGVLGRKKSNSDYATGRDYFIEYYEVKPVLSYQPNTVFRIGLNIKYSEKKNQSDLQETAVIRDIGIDIRFNQKKKGSLSAKFNYIVIDYNESQNTSLAFEMLEGLKTGNNFTWGFTYQRKVAKNLQLNFNYNGRKSETNGPIHAGGMELRAFF